MADEYNRPSFGIYALRVISIVVAILLFIFIIWGLFRLADGSSFWTTFFKVILIIGIIAAAIALIGFVVRLISRSTIGIMAGRVLSVIAGIIIVLLAFWGVAQIAGDSDDNKEVTSGTTSQPESGQNKKKNNQNQNNGQGQGNVAGSNSGSGATGGSTTGQTPTTGPSTGSGSGLPNTGPEEVLLPALSLGALVVATRAFISSKKDLEIPS